YGLIVSGWSADYDYALGEAIVRCGRFKFSTYWMARGETSARATDLIAKRQAAVLPIESGDDAFERLESRIASIEAMRMPHPLSPALAMAEAKRYLSPPQQPIKLHDLVEAELQRVVEAVGRVSMPWDTKYTADEFISRVHRI